MVFGGCEFLPFSRPRDKSVTGNYFLISQPKHVVGTKKKCFIEHPKHRFKLMDKKIIAVLR